MRSSALLPALLWLSCSSQPPAGGDGGTPLVCTAPEIACGGRCANLASDSEHCGDCGVACPMDQACAGSRCYPRACGNVTCAGTHVCLDGACVERACFGVSCMTGSVCAGGMCRPTSCGSVPCPSSQVCISDTCVEATCAGVLCPPGSLCSNGICSRDTCDNGLKDGNESDVDCGGICRPCVTGAACTGALDCQSHACTSSRCAAPSCNDAIRNGDEGDVDCGGSCPACATGSRCVAASQCASKICTMGSCAAPSCTDMVQNGLETARDCGGNCPGCATGSACQSGADCMTGLCTLGVCVSAQCQNGVKDGAETDVDCGGACAPCANMKTCTTGTDCQSQVCTAAMVCAVPSCTDVHKNGTETDVDCGGMCPMKCAVGKGCASPSDCGTGVCRMGACAASTCFDTVKNGAETDVDCGGGSCPRCTPGKACLTGADCTFMACDGGACSGQLVLGVPIPFTVGMAPYEIEKGDLDGDGKMDLVVSDEGSYDLMVFYGSADAGLEPGPVLQVSNAGGALGPKGIGIGDLNGDGKADLVTARMAIYSCSVSGSGWSSCTVSKFLNAGSRNFLGGVDQAVGTTTGGQRGGCGHRVSMGKLDADARWDPVISDEARAYGGGCSGAVTPCNNNCTDNYDTIAAWAYTTDVMGNLSAPFALVQAGPYVATADVDGDGNLDVVSRSFRQSRLRIFLGTGAATFAAPTDVTVSPGVGDIRVGRVDMDNLLDIAVVSKSSNRVGVAFGNGAGTFLAPGDIAVNSPDGIAIGDLDLDGKFDLVVGGVGIVLVRGNGDRTFQPPQVINPQLGDVGDIEVADFNGDGKLDVAALSNGRLWLMLNAL